MVYGLHTGMIYFSPIAGENLIADLLDGTDFRFCLFGCARQENYFFESISMLEIIFLG